MENPTRNASARAMPPVFGLPSAPFPEPFIMKYRAEPKLARMAMNAIETRYVMKRIIP